MKKNEFRTYLDHPVSDETVVPVESGIVETGYHEETDINCIVKRFMSGDIDAIAEGSRKPIFGDFTSVKTFDDAKQAVIQAERDFMDLPVEIRNRFDNDPAKLLRFVEDDKNLDEAIKLGIAVAPEGYKTPEQRLFEKAAKASAGESTPATS